MQRKESLTIKLNSEINADSLRSYVTWLQGSGTRFALADNHRNIALKIMKKFISMGYTTCSLDSFIIVKTYGKVNYRQWQYNVTATIRGTLYADSICLIGAHYDNILSSGDPFSVGSGANDNASGVAAVLEIARVMKRNNFSPANTLIFAAFGSEELGLFGSYAFSDSLNKNSGKIKLMLNNDMIAYQPSPLKSDWIVNIADYNNSHNLRADAELLCTKYTALRFTNFNTYNKQTDSYPFFVNGFKALYFTSANTDPYYHTLNDVAGNCNFEYCREIVMLCCAILIDKN
jgi:Zn-dependent M28 family amino/carboxypeptidase